MTNGAGTGRTRAILVLGMHRSGTSAVSRVLGLCGAALPRETWEPDENNTRGYWEPAPVVRVHDELLRSLGSSFDDVGALKLGWESAAAAAGYGRRLVEALEASYEPGSLWVVKDPRLCRLFPLWRGVLDRLRVEPLAVLPIRNPLEIAASLAARDGFPPTKSFLLWLRHLLEAEAATRDIPRSFVSYESLLRDWRQALGRIGRDLSLAWPRSLEEAAPEVDAFLEARGRHHVASSRDLEVQPEVSTWVRAAYGWASQATEGRSPALGTLDSIREALSAADVTFLPLLSELARERSRLQQEGERLQAELRLASEEARSLQVSLGERDAAIAGRQGELDHSRAEAAALQARLEASERRNADLEKALDHSRAETATAQARLDASEARRADLESETLRLAGQLREAGEHAGRLTSEIEQQQAAVAESRAEEKRLREELSTLAARVQDLERQVDRAVTTSREHAAATDAVRTRWQRLLLELNRIQTSAAWQLASPLRWAERRWPALVRGLTGPPKLLFWAATGRLAYRLRLRRQARAILESGLFDESWYTVHNPEVVEAGGNPLTHFLEQGTDQGWDPSPLFGTRWYLERNPDVAASRTNPLAHYVMRGAVEGRDPNPLFDSDWYLRRYPDVRAAGVNPLAHYLRGGAAEGRDPNPLFDSDWYLWRYPDVAAAGVNPLVHYLHYGGLEGRYASPLFDGGWYRQRYPDVAAAGVNPLAHFLWSGAGENRDPNPLFETKWYLERNPDVARSGANPLVHFLECGAAEGRDPGPGFDTRWYVSRNPAAAAAGQNPLAHYLHVGKEAGLSPHPTAGGGTSGRAYADHVLSSPTARDPAYRDFTTHETVGSDVKAVAFYLPQFHPIPQNDEWWGKGFTEWTNVSRAVPQFPGHYEPRLPGELGFYDLRLPEIQRRQVELARNYGIHAFCFHFYWFGGRRLLERPLQRFIDDPSLDISFCVCWANENWSRRWDGSEHEVLMAQRHSPEDDRAVIGELSSLFRDPRYLRVGGRPILVVYRVDILPDAAATAERWRAECHELGVGEILLVAAQSFGIEDPRPYGFDAAVEFPPHGSLAVQPITRGLPGLNPDFSGEVFAYEAFANHFARLPAPNYTLFKTVCPSWDNSPRALERGRVYHGSTPEAYRAWLEAACRFADGHPVSGERIVFLNAWNEWGEGAYLEPDRRFGYAYLEATRDALEGWQRAQARARPNNRIVLAIHNALNYGAQQNALQLARTLHRTLRLRVDVIDQGVAHFQGETLLRPKGELTPLFQREGQVHDLVGEYPDPGARRRLLARLRDEGAEIAICYTAVSGPLVAELKDCGFRVLCLIHELPSLIRESGLEGSVEAIARRADLVVCGSELVRQGFLAMQPEAEGRTITRHQGLYKPPPPSGMRSTRPEKRTTLGLPGAGRLVLGVGYADLRKGFDLFMRVVARLAAADQSLTFVWLGCELPMLMHWARHDAERLGFSERLHLLPRVDDVHSYYAASDLLLLPSREDPFPSVVLEALSQAVPVVAFEGATGAVELLHEGCGSTVPYGDDEAMAAEALRLLHDDDERERMGQRGRAIVAEDLDWRDYVYELLDRMGEHRHRVSVVVPNYNYARHLERRLESVFSQGYPVYEVIVLDDASTDESVEIVKRLQRAREWDLRLVTAESNSGSVFEQWHRGVELARGDLVWIAEADDWAESDLVATLSRSFDDPGVVLAYSQSRQVDEEGQVIAPDYLDYVKDIDDAKWRRSWVRDGRDELREAFVVKNTIPNVSAALFRREPLRRVLREDLGFIRTFGVAGDYACYFRLLARGGKVAFASQALNNHRRHERGVTLQAFGVGLMAEIARLQTAIYESVEATPEAASKAALYLGALAWQFQVVPDGRHWGQHPKLAHLASHPLYASAVGSCGLKGTQEEGA